jgi:hypothetical protein
VNDSELELKLLDNCRCMIDEFLTVTTTNESVTPKHR